MDRTLDLARQADYFWALLPEIVLAAWGMLVLMVDVFQKGNRSEPSRPMITWLSLAGLVATGAANLALIGMRDVSATGLVAVDGVRVFVNFVILLSAAMALLIAHGYLDDRGINRGEFHALVLFAALGMMLMAGARDLMMIFIGLEVMSVAIYVLVGFDRMDPRSAEAALKYFLLGAFSSAFFLFGIALTWGSLGTTNVDTLSGAITSGGVTPMLMAGIALLLVGFGFKTAAMPFHMWTPDAYEGAPTPVAALMATGVKAAAFAAFFRVFVVGLIGAYEQWMDVMAWLAAITMFGANLVALTQGSVKRMLAYSSIAHAGYLLVALTAASGGGFTALLFYLLVYTLATAGAFGIVIANSRDGQERVTLEDYAGFARQQPLLAAVFAVFLLSLAGFPLTAGFIGKLVVLQAAVEQGQAMLAVLLVLASLISYFYYLRVVIVMYMRPARSADAHASAGLHQAGMATVVLAAVAVVVFFFLAPVPLRWAEQGSADLFRGRQTTVQGAAAVAQQAP